MSCRIILVFSMVCFGYLVGLCSILIMVLLE